MAQVVRKVLSPFIIFLFLSTTTFAQKQTFAELLALAKKGEAWAQNEVGLAYSWGGTSTGERVRPNSKRAIYWLKKSAEKGLPLGACNLGYHYGIGRGVTKNLVMMVKWVSIGEVLDPLRCGSEAAVRLKPSTCERDVGWQMAHEWLKAHPDLKNNFKQQPWLSDPVEDLSPKCKQKRR
ncbi:MAG: tetratricopeptide repeat protein [Pyrinomonadaceae bacterium]